jgi:hypothetical protein
MHAKSEKSILCQILYLSINIKKELVFQLAHRLYPQEKLNESYKENLTMLRKPILHLFLNIIICSSAFSSTNEITISSSTGDHFVINADSEDSFLEIMDQIGNRLALSLDNRPSNPLKKFFSSAKSVKKYSRDYNVLPSQKEKDIITYITLTCANKSLLKLWKERDSIRKSGDKLLNLHPLRFLQTIFENEELKAAIASLYSRDWVWSEFKRGIVDTLHEENNKKNLRNEHVEDFAKIVKIPSNILYPYIQKADWDGLLYALIENVPRAGNPSRYDM